MYVSERLMKQRRKAIESAIPSLIDRYLLPTFIQGSKHNFNNKKE